AGGPEASTRTGGAVEALGIDFGHTFVGIMAAFAEGIGGILVALGLVFRPARMLIMFTMTVAANMHIVTGQGGPAHAMKNAFFFFGLLFVGPGRFSLDAMLSRRRTGERPSPETLAQA